MKDDPVTDALLRQYLLGEVEDQQRQWIESLFLTDPRSKERLFAAEQDLIEDYLEDSLTTADRERFLLHYAATPAQRRKLRIMKSVKEWAIKENLARVSPSAISVWSRLRAGLKLNPVFVIPIAATTMIAIAVAIWLSHRTGQQNSEHLAKQEELARLNDPSNLHEVEPQKSSFELAPVSVRSVEREAELTRRSDVRVVELRLLWMQKEQYPTYRAVIQRLGDAESFTVGGLHADGNGGKVIRLRLPVSMLTQGLYRIQVSGINEVGANGPLEEYKFNVSG